MFKCDLCGKEFERERQLLSHMPHCERKQEREKRIPLGVPRAKLSFDVPKGKVGRVVCDRPGRLEQALKGGYEFVTDRNGEQKLGDDNGNSDLGSQVSRVVGTHEDGRPMRGYLMAIDKELYDADQEAKQEDVRKVDEAIKDGNLNEKPEDGRYIPSEGIQISRGPAKEIKNG